MQDTALPPMPATLLHLLATVPDPRRAQGRRFPLGAVLALALAAILANHHSELAIAQWGAAQPPDVLRALGFARGKAPHQTTLQRLFRALTPAPLAAACGRYFAPADRDRMARGKMGVAIDGKTLRGVLPFAPPHATPVHLLTAFCHATGTVLAQQEIAAVGDKAAALNAAPALIAQLDWHARVLTGDARYCQREWCEQVVNAGGDYLVIVKGNQPALHRAIAVLFASRADVALAAATLPARDLREATTWDRGHGRQERRRVIASTELHAYLDWPAPQQVFMVERQWREREQTHTCVRYGITSLPAPFAPAARLLTLVRDHWGIENGLHYVKDVTLGEDASTLHVGTGPTVMAILRNTVVSLIHRAGFRTVAARLRFHSTHPQTALALLGLSLTENA